MVLQLRKMLSAHSEGWVKLADGEHQEAGLLKTRRMRRGQNMLTECEVLRQLEFMEYLSASAATEQGEDDDERKCRSTAASMRRVCSFLLGSNGYFWVDCSKVFTNILHSN